MVEFATWLAISLRSAAPQPSHSSIMATLWLHGSALVSRAEPMFLKNMRSSRPAQELKKASPEPEESGTSREMSISSRPAAARPPAGTV
jgi:hypothetical protein